MIARRERKFVVAGRSAPAWRERLLRLPGLFREAYAPREVHSLYFDTPDRGHYRAAVDGEGKRRKVRLRWYGAAFGRSCPGALEIKRRHGGVFEKEVTSVGRIRPSSHWNLAAIAAALAGLGPAVRRSVEGLRPMVLVSYERRYFEASSGRLRATIDDRITFRMWRPRGGFSSRRRAPHVVLELKYPPESELRASRAAARLAARLSRHSKYVLGVESVGI